MASIYLLDNTALESHKLFTLCAYKFFEESWVRTMEKTELGPHFPRSYLVSRYWRFLIDYFFICSYRDLSEA